MVRYGQGHNAVSQFRSSDVCGNEKSFKNLNLKPWLAKSLLKNGYRWQSKVQEATLPAALTGNDILIQSKSGTGKTLIFAITILERINEECDNIQALVLTPTREIALQVLETIKSLSDGNVRFLMTIGGTSLIQNRRQLKKDRPQIIIGTPGRILDLFSRGDFSGSGVELLVLDEADELLENDTFRIQVNNIREGLTKFKMQTMCLSATYPKILDTCLGNFMRPNPIIIRNENVKLDGIKCSILSLPESEGSKRSEEKLNVLSYLLEHVEYTQCFIFAHNHSTAQRVNIFLTAKGWGNTLLSGRLQQESRTQAWEQLVSRETTILVSTDVGARGLDSAHADLVINIECGKSEVMAHRIGRGGRFGKEAQSIFISNSTEERNLLEKFGKDIKIKFSDYTEVEKLVENVNSNLNSAKVVREQENATLPDEIKESDSINSGQKVLSSLIDDALYIDEEESHPSESVYKTPVEKPTQNSCLPQVSQNLPQIPPIWYTLRMEKPSYHEDLDELDNMTDEQFNTWRTITNPRQLPDFQDVDWSMAPRGRNAGVQKKLKKHHEPTQKIEENLNLGFTTSTLKTSDLLRSASNFTPTREKEQLEEFEIIDENDFTEPKEYYERSNEPFINIYENLYARWRSLHL